MSSQPSAPSAPPSDDGAKGSRLHIRGIREMPAGNDEQLAIIFKEMRRAAGASHEEIALRLATTAQTIAELERGSVPALAEWSELERIVSAYTAQLGLDARPVLRRLKAQAVVEAPTVTPQVVQAPAPPRPPSPPTPPAPPARASAPRPGALPMPPSAAVPVQAKPAPPQAPSPTPPPPPQRRAAPPQSPRAAPAAPPVSQTAPPRPQPRAAPAQTQAAVPAREAETKKPKPGRLGKLLRPALNWAILLGFVAALGAGVWYAAKRPRAVWSTLDSLPAPIPRLMRSAWELVRPIPDTKPRPQVSDPDNRKSDKLR